ncbi:MAG: hypothetical protein ACLFUS_06880, partial [Candidatus Sumerlaeia bacterium]
MLRNSSYHVSTKIGKPLSGYIFLMVYDINGGQTDFLKGQIGASLSDYSTLVQAFKRDIRAKGPQQLFFKTACPCLDFIANLESLP